MPGGAPKSPGLPKPPEVLGSSRDVGVLLGQEELKPPVLWEGAGKWWFGASGKAPGLPARGMGGMVRALEASPWSCSWAVAFPLHAMLAAEPPRVRLKDVFPNLPQSEPEPAAPGTSPVCPRLALNAC